MRSLIQQHRFVLVLMSLSLFYLVVEFFLNQYIMLAVDEFWFAHIIYHYKDALPYRDFAPYKTVLGYYLLLPLILSNKGILPTLFFTKNVIATINAIIFFSASFWLTKFFSKIGVLSSLIILIVSDVVLSFSTNIRVDLFGYWFCFFALLCLMERRALLAGLLMGLGFITTQKVVWYILASNIALAAQWLLFYRNKKMFSHLVSYNCVTGCMIAIYMVFWTVIADWHTVFASIFQEASILYHLDWYDSARLPFWTYNICYNPLIFALWPLTLFSLVITFENDASYQQRFFIVINGLVILLCLIAYKMIFPYYLQVIIPVTLILYAAFFSWLYNLFRVNQTMRLILPAHLLWLYLFFCLGMMIYITALLNLPLVYLLFCFISILLMTMIVYQRQLGSQIAFLFKQLIFISMIFIGGIYPLTIFFLKENGTHGDYQQAHIKAINELLKDGSDYVAGIELIYNKTQPILGLRQLVGPTIDYLTNHSEKLKPFMLASLYQNPNITDTEIINALKKSAVKFYVNTYRMDALPDNIKNYLRSQYENLWGSIYYYAPLISAGNQKVTLKFSGRYQVEASIENQIQLAGKVYSNEVVLTLKKGDYISIAQHDYRLKLLPEISTDYFDPRFKDEQVTRMVE